MLLHAVAPCMQEKIHFFDRSRGRMFNEERVIRKKEKKGRGR